jgi:cell shape-determining protein MreC
MARRRNNAPLTVLLIVLTIVLVGGALLLRGPLSSLLWRVLAPVVAWRDSLGSGQLAELKAELASSTAALADRDSLYAENVQLRAELGRSAGVHSIAAAVLLTPPGTPYDTLVVDAGSAQGVVPGAQVRAGALAIGTVDEVYANSSRVALYSSPGQSYNATLTSSDTAIPIIVEGQGAGSMQARVPAATAVVVGDRVEFPGLSGFMAGTITGIVGSDTDTFKTIYVRLPVDLFSLRYVYIQQ